MERYSQKIILRKECINKDGYGTLSLQVFINGRRKVLAIGIKVEPEYWQDKQQRVKLPPNRKAEEVDINMMVTQKISKANEIFIQHRMSEVTLTPEIFVKKFYQTGSQFDFFQYAERIQPEFDRINAPGTSKNDRDALKKLRQFQDKITFSELTEHFCRRFNEFLVGQGLGQNTRWKHIKTINKYIERAKRDEIIRENTFSNYKVRKAKVEKVYLTKDELQRIITLYYSGNITGTLKDSAEGFILAATSGGMRHSDWMLLTTDNIIGNVLAYNPYKTKRFKTTLIKLNLTDIAKNIIEGRQGKLLNIRPLQQTNEDLKIIASLCDIDKNISTHTARHTFATQFLEQGGRVELLQKILGHSDITMTMEYVHILDSSVRKSMELMNVFSLPNQ